MSTTTQQQPAPDFGEPWQRTTFRNCIRDRSGILATLEDDLRDRSLACVNACAGMADPVTEIQAMREAIRVAHEALDNCIEFINDAQIIEAQWHWEPVKQSKAALAKLQSFFKP